MEKCVNEMLFRERQEKQETLDVFFDIFLEDIENELQEIRELVQTVKYKAEKYNYDFSEEVKEILEDTINEQ